MKSKKNKYKSSSFHLLSADKNLSILEKISWFILNFVSNNLPPKIPFDKEIINIKNFKPKLFDKDWVALEKTVSPSRMLCDLFWKKLNWKIIKKELNQINVFDTGCGQGKYGLIINNFSEGINTYRGVDTYQHDNWLELANKYPFLSYKKQNADNILDDIPSNTNLFITQSAIEHFNYDLSYFIQLKNFIRKNKRNTIQIHLFPAPPSLWLYLLHGVRQYNFRSIKKIVDIFDAFELKSYSSLIKLGGNASNFVHLKYITWPQIIKTAGKNSFRDLFPEKYFNIAKKSIIKDMQSNKFNNCAFYALIIHSNYKNKIF